MAFEVGKKYKRLRHIGVFECLAVHDTPGSKWGFFLGVEGTTGRDDVWHIPRTYQWGAEWSEYKEPRTLSRWINVWEYDGVVRMNSSLYNSKEEAIGMADRNFSNSALKLLDTIEVKWTEKC
jgi:hypothetical protein